MSPRDTPSLFGHAAAEAKLLRALASRRFPHAWLFAGPRGVGKATLAYRLARALLDGGARPLAGLAMPPDHPVFRQVAQGAHPDLTVLERPRDPKSGRLKADIPVEAVRDAADALHTSPAGRGHRVVLIDGGEAMNRNAANALLKILEEPPARATLLVVAHRPGALPNTVRSRCAVLRLRPLGEAEAVAALRGLAPELSSERAAALVAFAGGAPGRALALAGDEAAALYERLLRALAPDRPDPDALAGLADDLGRLASGEGIERVEEVTHDLLSRAVRARLGRTPLPVFPDEPALLGRFAERRPLERLAALWDNSGRLTRAASGLALDGGHVAAHLLAEMARTGDRASP